MQRPDEVLAYKEASTVVGATPEAVFDLVSDLPRMGEWSPEAVGGEWKDGGNGAVGDWFVGQNRAGEREWTRESEVAILANAVRETAATTSIDAMIIAGDYNLVGGRGPLESLIAGLDLDGSDLGVANPMQPDGRSNSTWCDPGQPFAEGRLDYVVYADSSMKAHHAAVLDTRDLGPALLQKYGLQPNDGLASDHLPILVDFVIE